MRRWGGEGGQSALTLVRDEDDPTDLRCSASHLMISSGDEDAAEVEAMAGDCMQ